MVRLACAKNACFLISPPVIETCCVTSSRDWCEALVILWNSTTERNFVIKMQVEKIWRKNQTFLGAPLSSVVWYITEKMHVQLNVCFKHLRNIQFFSKPAFHSLFRAPRWYGKRIEKSGARKRMRAGERRVLKMEPLRIDCLPFTWANLWVHGLGKW